MNRSRITILGSSSGMPSPSRFCSSFLLETDKEKYLFDAGEGVSFSLLRNRIDFNQINFVFITHSHIDHLGGLFLLIQMMHLTQRKTPLNIHLPQEALEGVESFLRTLYLFKEKLTLKLNLYPIKPNFTFKNEEITVNTYLNRHLLGNEEVIREYGFPNRMQSFCFVVSWSAGSTGDEKKMIYSGDILSSDDLANLIFDADLVITECTHPRLEKLLSLMKESKVNSAIFTHIPVELEGNERSIL